MGMYPEDNKHAANRTFFHKATSSKVSIADIFSDVFKPHTKADGEGIFLAGTAGNIPDTDEMLLRWRKPWLFLRVLGVFVVLLGLLYLFDQQGYGIYADNPFVFFSAMAVPFCTLLFYMEMNIPKNIPLYEVILMLLIGGILSLILTGIFNQFNQDAPSQLAPLTEEPSKLLALIIFLRKPNRRYILNGILIGGAVGAGFAAFESVGYFYKSVNGLDVALTRALLSPGGHVLWAALYGGALAMVKEGRSIGWSHFSDMRFLKYFGAAILLHFIWNYPFVLVPLPVVGDAKYLLLICGGWALLLQLINKGVRQVMDLSSNMHAHPSAFKYETGHKPALYCVRGSFTGNSISLNKGTLVMGRDAQKCNLVFPAGEKSISRCHCALVWDGNDVWLTDEGSSYGTYLNNGKRLGPGEKWKLEFGTRFCLAGMENVFELQEEKVEA